MGSARYFDKLVEARVKETGLLNAQITELAAEAVTIL